MNKKGFTQHHFSGLTVNSTFCKKSAGFTLVELLVVIAIIGVLSTLAVVSLNNARAKSRDAKRVSDIKQIQTALELYFADLNTYPVQGTTAAKITLGGETALCLDEDAFVAACDAGGTTYMGQVPSNPTPEGTAYLYHATDSAGADCTSGTCTSYIIDFTIEGVVGSLAAGAHTATPSGI